MWQRLRIGAARAEEFETKDPGEFVHRLKSMVTAPCQVHPTQPQFFAKVRIAPVERLGPFVTRVEHGDVVVEPEFRKLAAWSAEAAQVFRALSACWREAIRGGSAEQLEEERDAVVGEIAEALIASAPPHD